MKLIACRTEEFDLGLGTLVRDPQTGRFSAGDWKGGNSVVWEYTFDLETGATTEVRTAAASCRLLLRLRSALGLHLLVCACDVVCVGVSC